MGKKLEITVRVGTLEEAFTVNTAVKEMGAIDSPAYFERRIKSQPHLVLVASAAGQLIGYLVGYKPPMSGSFYIGWTGVNPAVRKKGVLTALTNYLEPWAWSSGYDGITVLTHNRHRAMLAYLVKAGYNFTGIETAGRDIADFALYFKKLQP